MSNCSTSVFQLVDDVNSLEDVITRILTIRQEDELRNITATQLENAPVQERIFVSKWRGYEDFTQEISTLQMPNGDRVRFLLREAYVETSRIRRNMFDDDGELLPKPQRTIVESIRTVFFELNERVYSIIFTTNPTSLNKIKQKLLDNGNYFEPVSENYLINGDLFYWLFYKYENANKLIFERFEVEAIEGFLGNIADETNRIKGDSDEIPNLLVTKAFVSKFHPIRALNVTLKYDDYRLSLIFNDTSDCWISTACRIPINRLDKDIASAIIIYAFLIPCLQSVFSNDNEWSLDVKTQFAKNIGIEVIKEIADFHGLILHEIE